MYVADQLRTNLRACGQLTFVALTSTPAFGTSRHSRVAAAAGSAAANDAIKIRPPTMLGQKPRRVAWRNTVVHPWLGAAITARPRCT
jgi:hypothetical protein